MMANQEVDFPNFYNAFDDTEEEFLQERGGTAKALTKEIIVGKAELGTDAGCMAVVVSYMEHSSTTRCGSSQK